MQTDIFNIVEKYKVKWINNEGNVDADWDGYINELKKLKAERFIEIQQEAYDIYEKVMKELGM